MSDSTPFVFKFRGECDASGRLVAAVVRYDGGRDKLQRAASSQGVTVTDAKADKQGNPRIRISGGNVQSALGQYAQRAGRQGEYKLGDIGIF